MPIIIQELFYNFQKKWIWKYSFFS